MSNARFSIVQAVAVKDKRITDSQFRTLSALGMYADKAGWCYPSLKTLAKDLNKSSQAVGRDTIALRKLGYLEVKRRYDKSSGANQSNLYRLVFDLDIPYQRDVDTLSTSDVDTLSTSDVELTPQLTTHLTIDKKEGKPQNEIVTGEIFTIWQNNIGLLTPIDSDAVGDMIDTYPPDWIKEAIRLAVTNNARKLSYIAAVLKGWKANGYGWKPERYKPASTAHQPKQPARPKAKVLS